jgi:hypothetical protein
VRSEGNMSLKNPVTPPGIDPVTVRLVAQRLNHYATQTPIHVKYCVNLLLLVFQIYVSFLYIFASLLFIFFSRNFQLFALPLLFLLLFIFNFLHTFSFSCHLFLVLFLSSILKYFLASLFSWEGRGVLSQNFDFLT